MSLNRAQDLVDSFNNGEFDEDIEPFFNDYITFFKFIKKYGLLGELDLGQLRFSDWDDEIIEYLDESGVLTNLKYDDAPDELKNRLLLKGLNENYKDTVTYILDNLLTDVEIRNGGFYLRLRDREELADYFCSTTGRRNGVKHVAEQIFSEEGLEYGYFDSNSKPYETVSELDDANLIRLKDIIYKEIGDTELSLDDYNSDFFEFLSEEQGTPGYFRIRPQDLNGLLKDSEATNELFSNDLEEIGSNLRNLYYNAENSAYEEETYNTFYSGLDEYFEGKIDEVPSKKGEKTTYIQYIKIRDFIGNVRTFLEEEINGNYPNSLLDYYGSYTDLITSSNNDGLFECISVRIPEYPDYSLTQKNINEMFSDYV